MKNKETYIKLTGRDNLVISVNTKNIVLYHKIIRDFNVKGWWSKKRKQKEINRNSEFNTFIWLTDKIYLKVAETTKQVEKLLGLKTKK